MQHQYVWKVLKKRCKNFENVRRNTQHKTGKIRRKTAFV